jgi:hypothetical protein
MNLSDNQNVEVLTSLPPDVAQQQDVIGGKVVQPVDRFSEIEYLYLDFDIQLPTPAFHSSSISDGTSPPEAPNLKPYTSPFLWPESRKRLTTSIACFVTILAASAGGELSPAAAQLQSIWNVSLVAFNVGITSFTTGFAIAPMVMAPFSEINGRRPLFILSGILFTGMFELVTKSSPSIWNSNWSSSQPA